MRCFEVATSRLPTGIRPCIRFDFRDGAGKATIDLFTPTNPLHKSTNLGMGHQIGNGVEISTQVLLTRYEFVNRTVAIPTCRNGQAHLVPCVSLLKPTILVTATRNQMVLRRTMLENSKTESALIGLKLRRLGGLVFCRG
jgi:hypothetical protein